jgi:regulator of sigma E protease
MGTAIMIGQLILALAILVTLHELGHFLAARAFGIKVEKFYLFFDAWGVKLFSFKKGETEYGIGWLPLGGYVKIAGMVDESLDKEQLNSEPQSWEFRSKPAWQRLIVMIGGVTVNFFLGILIFAGALFYYGEKYLPNEAVINGHGIMVDELGSYAGLQNGDKILVVNGKKLEKFNDIYSANIVLADKIDMTIRRNGKDTSITLPSDFIKRFTDNKGKGFVSLRFSPVVGQVEPKSGADKAGIQKLDKITKVEGIEIAYFDELAAVLAEKKGKEINITVDRAGAPVDLKVQLDTAGKMGFRPTDEMDYVGQYKTIEYGFFESFPKGFNKGVNAIVTQVSAFGQMFSGKIDPTKSLMGPIQLAKVFGDQWIWEKFWALTGLLSLVLAFMNLLPIPALDGGHVVFLLIEMIIRRPLSEKFMYAMQLVGMVILIGLMVFIFGNDLFQVIFNK